MGGAILLWLAMLSSPPGDVAAPAAPTAAPITRVAWLAGCWERRNGERLSEEQWMAPRGGLMLGMNRTVRGDALRSSEVMRIQEVDAKLVFTAHPSGQDEASFTATEVAEGRVVFESPTHDFPQRIIYQRAEDGSLHARIEGVRDGKSRGIDFPMQRVPCPAAD